MSFIIDPFKFAAPGGGGGAAPTLLQAKAAGGRVQGSLQFDSACTPGSSILCFVALRGTVSSVGDGTNTYAKVQVSSTDVQDESGTEPGWFAYLYRAENSSSSALTVDPAYGGGADFDTIIISEWDGLGDAVDWATGEANNSAVSIAVGNSPGDNHVGITCARALYGAGFASTQSGHTLIGDIEPSGGTIIAAVSFYRERDNGVDFTGEATVNEGDNFWHGFAVLFEPA